MSYDNDSLKGASEEACSHIRELQIGMEKKIVALTRFLFLSLLTLYLRPYLATVCLICFPTLCSSFGSLFEGQLT